VFDPRMPEISAEAQHLPIRIEPVAVPAHDGAHGERVPLIPHSELAT
jgi:hypothetical protein